jgi:hypothetical protein
LELQDVDLLIVVRFACGVGFGRLERAKRTTGKPAKVTVVS